jgi:histidinol phosphatase-like enzyme
MTWAVFLDRDGVLSRASLRVREVAEIILKHRSRDEVRMQ